MAPHQSFQYSLVEAAERGSHASVNDRRHGTGVASGAFLQKYCAKCHRVIDAPRREKYCSDGCAHAGHLAQTRAWKRSFRERNGHWPHPPKDYWSAEKLREKNRESKARSRARKRQQRESEADRIAPRSKPAGNVESQPNHVSTEPETKTPAHSSNCERASRRPRETTRNGGDPCEPSTRPG